MVIRMHGQYICLLEGLNRWYGNDLNCFKNASNIVNFCLSCVDAVSFYVPFLSLEFLLIPNLWFLLQCFYIPKFFNYDLSTTKYIFVIDRQYQIILYDSKLVASLLTLEQRKKIMLLLLNLNLYSFSKEIFVLFSYLFGSFFLSFWGVGVLFAV